MNGILITTTTCPKCPAMKTWVADNIDFEIDVFDETSPGFTDILGDYSVTHAPTLILFDEDGKELFRGGEGSEVADFLKTQ